MSNYLAPREDSSPEQIMEYLVRCFHDGRNARLTPEPIATLIGYVEHLQATADHVPAVTQALLALLELAETEELIKLLITVTGRADERAAARVADLRAKVA